MDAIKGTAQSNKCSVCEAPITKASKSGKCSICSQRKGPPYKRLYNKLIACANRKQQTIDLTFEEFTEYTKITECTYCERPIEWVPYGKTAVRYNLDKKDPQDSYSRDNCVVCCWECNDLKSDKFTHEEFMLLGPTLKRIRITRSVEEKNGENT